MIRPASGYRRGVIGWMIIVLLLAIQPVMAQDDDEIELPETFVSEDRSIGFDYPEGWEVEENEDDGVVILTDGADLVIEFYNAELINTVNRFASDDSTTATFSRILEIFEIDVEEEVVEVEVGEGDEAEDVEVIGALVIDDGDATLAFLIELNIGGLTGYGFVRADGPALDVVAGTDILLAIIESFGDFVPAEEGAASVDDDKAGSDTDESAPTDAPSPFPTNTPIPPTPTPIPTATPIPPTPTPTPCTVSTNVERTTRLRVGPGLNRSSIAFLPTGRQFEVLGQADDDDGATWYRLDKFEAAPSRANSVNEIWVAARDVNERGDCDIVGLAAPPPIVPLVVQPTAAPPTEIGAPPATDEPTPSGGFSFDNPRIEFSVDRSQITSGECATLFWDAEFVDSLFLSGGQFSNQGVTGPESRTVCPSTTTTYTLTVNTRNGPVLRQVTITVTQGGGNCGPHSLPTTQTGNLAVGGNQTIFFEIDPCRTPLTVTISLSSNDFDTYVYAYDQNFGYLGENDDGGGNLNSRLTVTLPSGATGFYVEVNSFGGGGGGFYTLSVN